MAEQPLHRTLNALVELHGAEAVVTALADIIGWKAHHVRGCSDVRTVDRWAKAASALMWACHLHFKDLS